MNIFFSRYFLVLSMLSISAISADMMQVLDTTRNTVGIKEGDETTFGSHRNGDSITTASGKVFKPIAQLAVPLTGTPAYLMFKNYIGSYVQENSTPARMGSGTRIVFCSGTECLAK